MSRDPFLFRIFLSAFTVVSCYEEWEEAPTFVMLGKEGRIIYLGELRQMTAIPDQGVSLSLMARMWLQFILRGQSRLSLYR
jgi:lipoprotein